LKNLFGNGGILRIFGSPERYVTLSPEEAPDIESPGEANFCAIFKFCTKIVHNFRADFNRDQ